jgi:hypothetical protein
MSRNDKIVRTPFEYKVVRGGWGPSTDDDAQEDLNKLGQDGWQLVGILPGGIHEPTLIFMRAYYRD